MQYDAFFACYLWMPTVSLRPLQHTCISIRGHHIIQRHGCQQRTALCVCKDTIFHGGCTAAYIDIIGTPFLQCPRTDDHILPCLHRRHTQYDFAIFILHIQNRFRRLCTVCTNHKRGLCTGGRRSHRHITASHCNQRSPVHRKAAIIIRRFQAP